MNRANQLQNIGIRFRVDPDVGRWVVGNTVAAVWLSADGYHLTITTQGNEILYAHRTEDGIINVTIRHCGWPTSLTCNVLNAVLRGLGIESKVVRTNGHLFIDHLPQPHVNGMGEYVPEQEWLHVN